MNLRTHHMIIFFLLAVSCKQSYIPPAIAHPPSYLVVEGFIENNGADPTIFHLSRTIKLDSNNLAPEQGATVTIEDSTQNKYALTETTPGTYIYPAHQFLDNTPYRLHITTGGKDYTSDYVPLAYNPPIDSITFARVQTAPNDGVFIYANTHDPKNNTHYYRWQYKETWQFHSLHESPYLWFPDRGLIDSITLQDYTCWKSDSSTTIVLASTAQLSQDLVYHAPVVFIPNGSQQMTVKYSILVKQNTLTKPAFQWWQTLQKNTERIGSIFGVQPSANPGNIHCTTDSAEQVLGYIGGGNTDSVRIFVTSGQIAPWEFHPDCDDKVVATPGDYYIAGYLPWLFEPPPSGKVHIAYASCIDCRLIGSNSKPPFWQ
jgi:hypothetical protein